MTVTCCAVINALTVRQISAAQHHNDDAADAGTENVLHSGPASTPKVATVTLEPAAQASSEKSPTP